MFIEWLAEDLIETRTMTRRDRADYGEQIIRELKSISAILDFNDDNTV